ncbi:MAG: hypothetical protein MK209_00755 [Planctomycetes bacterium]|nr:hypothetical protein [Planctomycetota bacterium]
MRYQAVRPLCALVTIFVVVFVFGMAVDFAQSLGKASSPKIAHVEYSDQGLSEPAILGTESVYPTN